MDTDHYVFMLEAAKNLDDLNNKALQFALHITDPLQSNWTIGLNMKHLKEAVQIVEQKFTRQGATGRGWKHE